MTTFHSRFASEDFFAYEPTNDRFLLGALKREKIKHSLDALVKLFVPIPVGRARPNLAYRVEGNPLKGYDITLGINPKDYLRIIEEAVARIKSKILSYGIYGGSFMSEEIYYGQTT